MDTFIKITVGAFYLGLAWTVVQFGRNVAAETHAKYGEKVHEPGAGDTVAEPVPAS